MQIRPMTPEDFDELFTILNDLPLDMDSYEVEKFEFVNTIKRNPTSCLVVEEEGKIIGGVLGAYDGRRGWISHLGIHKDYQKKGYGKTLFEATEKALRDAGAKKINVWVKYDNFEVLPFYMKRHYVPENVAVVLHKNINKK